MFAGCETMVAPDTTCLEHSEHIADGKSISKARTVLCDQTAYISVIEPQQDDCRSVLKSHWQASIPPITAPTLYANEIAAFLPRKFGTSSYQTPTDPHAPLEVSTEAGREFSATTKQRS